MTRTRPVALATSLSLALAGTVLALAPQQAQAQPSTVAPFAATAPDDGGPNTYLSSPTEVLPSTRQRPAVQQKRPKPPPTKGTVTGRVVGPQGKPIRNALVMGIRFSDLGRPIDLTEEKRVLARTDKAGRFKLKQLRERYLIRVCSESVSDDSGGGHRVIRSGECDQETTKRFTPSYVGPDGTFNSWMRHTRMFRPALPTRALGRIVVQPPAVASGTWKDGANRLLYLTRIDGSIAATAFTDEKGAYRFEVAPGPYRIEADRHEGLRTDSTVPGFRSKRLLLRAGRTVKVSFRTKHAGIVRGQVTSNGSPLPDQFLAILDKRGHFAAGVVTNELGRYVVTSLKPGRYTVMSSFAAGDHVPAKKTVDVTVKNVANADLALARGSAVTFTPQDSSESVDAELRNAQGRVVKVYQGSPGDQVRFAGLPAGAYRLYVRRSALPSDGPVQVDFPWHAETVTVTGFSDVALGSLPLDQPTVNLTGTLPKGAQVKLTAVPEDAWLRPSHIDGDQVTPLALNWTVQESGGHYVTRGIVPGTYAAAVITALKDKGDRGTRTGGNVATTHRSVVVSGNAPTVAFTAPKGAKVRGRLRYDGTNRPVIAPFGFLVTDQGDRSWLFPTVSGRQKFNKPFRVERLHAGTASGRLIDLEELFAESPELLIPDDLLSSARNEPGTSYWFTARKRGIKLKKGKTVDVGIIHIRIHGVNGLHAVLGGGGREG